MVNDDESINEWISRGEQSVRERAEAANGAWGADGASKSVILMKFIYIRLYSFISYHMSCIVGDLSFI